MCPLQTGATGQPSLLTLVTITAGDDCEHPSLSLVHGHWPTPADSSRLAQVPLACGYAEHSSAPPRVDMQSPAGHSGLTAGLYPLSTECRPPGFVGLHTCGAGVLLLVAVDHALDALERIVGVMIMGRSSQMSCVIQQGLHPCQPRTGAPCQRVGACYRMRGGSRLACRQASAVVRCTLHPPR